MSKQYRIKLKNSYSNQHASKEWQTMDLVKEFLVNAWDTNYLRNFNTDS